MQRKFSGLVLLLLACDYAHAALLSRLSGQAYYDDVLDITWVADANLADTTTFGVVGVAADGSMNWATATAWIAAMNAASYLGKSDWRLPTVTDTGAAGCDYAFTGTDCGYNVDLATGEMAHLYYGSLGNLAYYDTAGSGPQPGWGLTNVGPFGNLQAANYWTGAEYAPDAGVAWNFGFWLGNQGGHAKDAGLYAWAVRPGDIAPIPVPGAMWLFCGALGVMGWLRRKAT